MAIQINEFLAAQGFFAHPFGTTNAEREAEVLPSFFVRVAWFDWIMGNPAQPESVILFAPQGYGKTSHRLEIGRRASERREAPALVVTINDFNPLVRAGIEHVTLDDYVALLRRAALDALDTQLHHAPQRQEQLQQDPQAAAYLHALLQLYLPRRVIGRAAPPYAEQYMDALGAEVIGPKEWLREIARLAACCGYVSVYCLLDGIDELNETRGNPAAMFHLLGPLLDAPGLLQECGWAFKFFLPQDIESEMKQQRIGRLDRIPHRVLSWSPQQLTTMLSQRLISFNRESATSPLTRIRTFQDLCQADFDVDAYLVQAADHSPRALIDLARAVLDEHCQNAAYADALITRETIVAGVARRAIPGSAVIVQPTPGPAPVAPLLFLDDRGDIWLGAQRIEQKLPALLRRTLEYLWQHRSRRVAYHELIDALYGADIDGRGDPQSSMEKLVRRLREVLEPAQPSSQTYVETQTGQGYVLRNWREA